VKDRGKREWEKSLKNSFRAAINFLFLHSLFPLSPLTLPFLFPGAVILRVDYAPEMS
jgi:hypothetical protein